MNLQPEAEALRWIPSAGQSCKTESRREGVERPAKKREKGECEKKNIILLFPKECGLLTV